MLRPMLQPESQSIVGGGFLMRNHQEGDVLESWTCMRRRKREVREGGMAAPEAFPVDR
jgi:hypothetical protein